MKKIVALLLALMMACSLIGVLAESAEVTGEWYLSAIDDGTGERKNPAEYTMEMVMVLNEDGTAASVVSMFGDSSEGAGTWTMDGDKITVTIEDSPAEFTLADGELSGDMGGAMGYFTREAPEAIVPPQVIAAESEEAFLGSWLCENIGMEGFILPAASMGMAAGYVIEPGRAAVAAGVDQEENVDVATYTTELVDGALVLTPETEGEDAITMQLNDNGQISFEMNLGEAVMTLYFGKIEE